MAIDVNAINAYRQAGGITNPAAGTVNSGTALNSASNQVQTPVNIAPGQVLGGEVIDVKNGEVTLRLDNNATLTASLDQNMEVSVGQKLMFQVTSNGEQTTLHPLYANLSNNNMANDALSEAGLKSTAANLAMISNMFDEGMSVNKQALQAMARVVDANPTTDPATIVQLTKLGLQVNELNIEQYENYKNFEHHIINVAEGLSTGLSDLLGTVTESAVGIDGTVTMVNNTDQTAIITADTTQAVLNENQLQLSNDILSLVSSGDKDWNAILNNPQVSGIAVQSIEVASNGPQVVVQEVPQAVPVEVEDVWAVSLNPDSEAAPEMNTSVNMGESTVNQDAGAALSQGTASDGSGQLMQNLMDDLSKLGMPAEELNNIANGTMSVNDLVDFVKTLINNNMSGSKLTDSQMETLTKLLNNQDFKQLVGNQLMKQMLLNPADVSKDGAVEELYKRLSEQSTRAIEILKDAGQTGSEVMKSAQNINDNVNFMNQLNHMMAYVQLPVRMTQENAHGELYVYTKKKNLANKDGNVSAFLHLDMDNLGPMDVYVAMQRNKVNTNFYLADESVLDLIESNISILDARLLKKGYNMNTTVTMKNPDEPRKTVVGEMLKEKSNGVVGGPIASKLSFDVRA
ncbi:MAG: flagellar hook-length control protein FliK [Lachnospiraceae bacterium]|nr:flagellar hook-length control protein FliK [Lachnospiraceae bacterium]